MCPTLKRNKDLPFPPPNGSNNGRAIEKSDGFLVQDSVFVYNSMWGTKHETNRLLKSCIDYESQLRVCRFYSHNSMHERKQHITTASPEERWKPLRVAEGRKGRKASAREK